ncbi:dihydroxyacetone kinase phosphoryl donor subunit DhaM [Moellerella wisconsensis]|uniref:dihydroxyacetone kinase phosphoryl donor subunit DhaM n=1 Tax=Moellerella wisconsensis TaxID=158849 RepID=UPI0030760079
MIGLVIVSHSAKLAAGIEELAAEMQNSTYCQIKIAAGIDDPIHPIGTDARRVMEAIEALSDANAIILLMDLGSAVLSAQTAVELLATDLAAKTYFCAAPIVEGAIAITVAASTNTNVSIDTLLSDAENSLIAKQAQLGDLAIHSNIAPLCVDNINTQNIDIKNSVNYLWVVRNVNGLHARPAAKISALLTPFDAQLILEKGSQQVNPKNMNQIALLQIRQGDQINLIASGNQSEEAINAFKILAADNFGEPLDNSTTLFYGQKSIEPIVSGLSFLWLRVAPSLNLRINTQNKSEKQKLTIALTQVAQNLNLIAQHAEKTYGASIAEIFRSHEILLTDQEIIQQLNQYIEQHQTSAYTAIDKTFADIAAQYRQINDEYLQARYLDIDDLRRQLLLSLTGQKTQFPTFGHPTLIISDTLYPSEIIQLACSNIIGIALSDGSPYAHTAIIAQKMGIPMLVNLGDKILSIHNNSKLIMDLKKSLLTIHS